METNPTTNSAVAVVETVNPEDALVAGFENAENTMFCSFAAETVEDKAALYNAINNPDVLISDYIGKVILMRDVILQAVQIVKEETGEVNTCPRVTIIDVDGNSFSCTSVGIYNALRNLIRIFGRPTWENGLPVIVRQITRGTRRIFTLDAAVKV